MQRHMPVNHHHHCEGRAGPRPTTVDVGVPPGDTDARSEQQHLKPQQHHRRRARAVFNLRFVAALTVLVAAWTGFFAAVGDDRDAAGAGLSAIDVEDKADREVGGGEDRVGDAVLYGVGTSWGSGTPPGRGIDEGSSPAAAASVSSTSNATSTTKPPDVVPVAVNRTSTAVESPPPLPSSLSPFPRIWCRNGHVPCGESDPNVRHAGAAPFENHDLPVELVQSSEIRRSGSLQGGSQRCKPYREWQTRSFPTCNAVHEMDFRGGVANGGSRGDSSDLDGGDQLDDFDGIRIDHLGKGQTREAWKVYNTASSASLFNASSSGGAPVPSKGGKGYMRGGDDYDVRYLSRPLVFKKLRWNEDYKEHMFEHQRIDALVTERLTSSRHVVDIYAYCGESVMNEWGDGGDFKTFYKDGAKNSLTPAQRLEFARDAATGLAEIHGVGIGGSDPPHSNWLDDYSPEQGGDRPPPLGPGGQGGEGGEVRKNLTSVIHHDLQVANFLIVGGRIKFHDFNNAKLLTWDYIKNERCGWSYESSCDSMRKNIMSLPQECLLGKEINTEKVEVFRFGTVLYWIIVGGYARNYFKADNIDAHDLTKPPQLSRKVEKRKDPATVAVVRAMMMAFTFEEEKRPSARSIAEFLANETVAIEQHSSARY